MLPLCECDKKGLGDQCSATSARLETLDNVVQNSMIKLAITYSLQGV